MELRQEFFNLSEGARVLRISRASLYKGIASGMIPIVRICGMRRIPREWIDNEVKKAVNDLGAKSKSAA